jgi:hypothetical protein
LVDVRLQRAATALSGSALRPAIEAQRPTLDEKKRNALNHPGAIWAHWRRSLKTGPKRERNLSVELERNFLLGAAGFEGPVNFDISETWDYRDPLSWQLARVIYDECTNGAPQGILYTETAATLLAMHLVRNLSTVTPPLKEIRRGGLPLSRLRRACDYMMSGLGEDISLQEVAASVELSIGHFSTAFKQSLGIIQGNRVKRLVTKGWRAESVVIH